MSDEEPIAWVTTPPEDVVRQYMGKGHPYDFGFMPGMTMLMAAHMRIAPFFGGLFREIMFGDGFLSRREREMVAAVTAAAQDCHY